MVAPISSHKNNNSKVVKHSPWKAYRELKKKQEEEKKKIKQAEARKLKRKNSKNTR